MDVKSIACVSCGAPLEISADAEYVNCAYCGTQLAVERGIKKLQAETVPMAETGKVQNMAHVPTGMMTSAATIPSHAPKDWTTALALCLLFGWLGVHRFYSGHTLLGLIQFVTFGGFGLWWLIDLWQILSGRYRDSKGFLLGNRNPAIGSGCAWAIGVFLLITFIGGLVAGASGSDSVSSAVVFLALIAGAAIFVFKYGQARRSGKQ